MPEAIEWPQLRVLCVGHSHLHCERHAALADADVLGRAGVEVATVIMNESRFEPHFREPTGLRPGALNRGLLDERLDQARSADVIYLSIGGTADCVFGLVEHPPPFDFILDEDQEVLPPVRSPPRAVIEKRVRP